MPIINYKQKYKLYIFVFLKLSCSTKILSFVLKFPYIKPMQKTEAFPSGERSTCNNATQLKH